MTQQRAHTFVLTLIVLVIASGCIPARVRNGALFGVDPVAPPVVRVRLPHEEPSQTVRGDGRYLINAFTADKHAPVTFSTDDRVVIKHTTAGLEVRGSGDVVLAKEATGITLFSQEPGHRLLVGKTPYHGTLIFGRFANKPIVVNRLNLDEYLTGVLTPELGERSDDEYEAVKAQAVAARTYALRHLGQYSLAPYDLKADVSDQVYVGASQQRDWVDHAVAETEGEVLTYNGDLIESYYHSTCGGKTDAIEDIWPKPAKPYLVSVNDDEFCSWSKYWTWTEEFTSKTLLANLEAYRKQTGAPIGKFTFVKDIELVRGTPGGRVLAMTVTTSSGLWTILADQTRWALGRPSRPGTILPSSNFSLDLKRDKSGHITTATVTGRGYGHGVGLCQCGMIGRARAGQRYRDILPHYYTGTQIELVY
jgi:stage II sporulation protein D